MPTSKVPFGINRDQHLLNDNGYKAEKRAMSSFASME